MHLLLIRSTKGLSGTETYNINLLHTLHKNFSINITFLTNLPLFASELRKAGLATRLMDWLPEEVGTKRQLLQFLFYASICIPRYLATIRRMENGIRFDVICLQSRTEMILLTPILKLLGYKIVWIQHGPFFVSKAAWLVKQLYVAASHFVDKIIVPSEDTKQDLFRGSIEKKRVIVIHIGLDVKAFTPYTITGIDRRRNELGLPVDAFVIGFLGTLTVEKGIEDFIKTAKWLKAERFKYVVIGDGPDNEKMRQNMTAIFTGFVLDTKKYLGTVDTLLFPTHHYEATSIAILEAQSMGIPVLATDIGGNREIITHGYNGFLYKLGDTKAMARDIRMLSKNRAKLQLMGKHARQTIVEKFNIEKQAIEFARFFKSL